MIKNFIAKLLLAAFSFIIAILLVEVLLYLFNFLKKQPGQLLYNKYYTADTENGYDIAINAPKFADYIDGQKLFYWGNNVGCFDNNYNNEDNYILLLGDSFTWGYAPFEDKWGILMEKNLKTRILKCGVSGYGTRQELGKAKKIINVTKKNPKVIVLGYFMGNDLQDDITFPSSIAIDGVLVGKNSVLDINSGTLHSWTDKQLRNRFDNFNKYCRDYKPAHPLLTQLACFSKRHLLVYPIVKNFLANNNFVKKIIKNNSFALAGTSFSDAIFDFLEYVPTSTYPWLDAAWNNNINNILEIKKLSEQIGAKFVIVLIPPISTIYPEEQKELIKLNDKINYNFKLPVEILTSRLSGQHVDYFDLTPYFMEYSKAINLPAGAPKDFFWSKDGHWNVLGNYFASLITSKFLIEKDFVVMGVSEKNERINQINKALLDYK